MEIPRAFVCAESKIFDVSEWAICQVGTYSVYSQAIETFFEYNKNPFDDVPCREWLVDQTLIDPVSM